MKRTRRRNRLAGARIVLVLAVCSFALFVASLVIRHRSFTTADSLMWNFGWTPVPAADGHPRRASSVGWQIITDRGIIDISRARGTVVDLFGTASRRGSFLHESFDQSVFVDFRWRFQPSRPSFEYRWDDYSFEILFPLWISPIGLAAITLWLSWVIYRRLRYSGPNRCRACGYSTMGNVSGVCPECGASLSDAEVEGSVR